MALAFGRLPAFQQAEFRSVRTYRDQHNRAYEVVIDSRDPTMSWVSQPIPKYRVPDKRMYPPSNFLKVVENEMGRMRVDYDAWLYLTLENEDEFNTELLKICQTQNPNDPLTLFNNPTAQVLRLAGPRPMPSALVRAMRAGNAWALGMKPANEVPPFVDVSIKSWLRRPATARTAVSDRSADEKFLIEDVDKYLDYEEQHDPEASGGKREAVRKHRSEYTDFVKEKSKEGLTIREIGPLWQEYKKAKNAALAG